MAAIGQSFNGNALAALRAGAGNDPRAAIQETAKQFEGLFMQELMKSMRSSTMASGMLDNAGTSMGTDLLDTQFAQKLTGMPNGLGTLIAKQLERQTGAAKGDADAATPVAAAAPGSAAGAPQAQVWNRLPGASQSQDFVARHSNAAEAVSAETGIPAAFILSQAALESGWGKREIKNADGSNSNNLFGIKAGADWKGATASVTTTEYVNGQPVKTVAKFRAYASAEDSFRDYAKLMKDSPRYANVVAQGGTAHGFAVNLQRAGYATDPAYASKLGNVINTTLRLQRSLTA